MILCPYNDAIFVKQPGLGGSVSWHQDGVTHWDSPEWDEGIHGFNFQVQLYDTSAMSCLWVAPGSHKAGKIDIEKLIEDERVRAARRSGPTACESWRRHHRQPPGAALLFRECIPRPAHLTDVWVPQKKLRAGCSRGAQRVDQCCVRRKTYRRAVSSHRSGHRRESPVLPRGNALPLSPDGGPRAGTRISFSELGKNH